MKKIIAVLLLSTSVCAQAQPFQKGTWLVGLQGAYQLKHDQFFKHSVLLKVQGGYFIANKLLIGLSGTRSQQKAPESFKSTIYTLGPTVRYQLTQTRFSPYLMTSFQLGQSRASGDLLLELPNGDVINYSAWQSSPYRMYSRSLGVGLLVSIVSGLKLEGSLIWQDFVERPNLNLNLRDDTNYQAQVGLTYQFGNR